MTGNVSQNLEMGLEMLWCDYFWTLKMGLATLASHTHFIQSKNQQTNFASEWLKFRLAKYRFFSRKVISRGSNNLFPKYNMTPHMNIRVNIFEKDHFKPLRQLFWKKTIFGSSAHKIVIFEPLKRNIHLSVFALYENRVCIS